ncbi:MAG: flippase [Flavobacteriaceae bacterium]|nr:flippase [Flavobacteriaceae bacterium]
MKVFNNIKDKNFIELLKGSSISLVVKVSAMLLSYLAMLFITNYYGAEEWGIYSLSFTVLSIVILVPKFGFENSIVRIVSELKINNNSIEIFSVLKKITFFSLSIAIVVILILNVFHESLAIKVLKEPKMSYNIQLISYILIPSLFLTIISATFQAYKKTMLFMLFQTGLINLFFLFFLFFLHLLNITKNIFEIYVYSTILALIIGVFTFSKVLKLKKNTQKNNIIYSYNKILNVSFPMMLSGSFALLMGWSDILMLSYYKTTFDVGVYNSTLRLAALSGVVLIAVNAIATPKFVEYYAKKDTKGLEDTVKKSTKIIFFTSTPILLILIFFSKQILSFFGDEFIIGYLALTYLCISRFINGISGSVGYIMQMTDQQSIYQNIIIIAFFINLILNYILIPKIGFNGAAIASSIAMVFWNITLVFIIKRKLGFWTIYIPFITK